MVNQKKRMMPHVREYLSRLGGKVDSRSRPPFRGRAYLEHHADSGLWHAQADVDDYIFTLENVLAGVDIHESRLDIGEASYGEGLLRLQGYAENAGWKDKKLVAEYVGAAYMYGHCLQAQLRGEDVPDYVQKMLNQSYRDRRAALVGHS
jgi:hypothetical protein